MSDGQNIQVFVRCRPLKENEKQAAIEVVPDRNEVRVPTQTKAFQYDQVFSAEAPQEDVYNSVVKPLIPQVLAGYNCAVFAYGQTGTGKTYTMEGERHDNSMSWGGTGIIPRAVNHLFDVLRQRGHEFNIKVSFLELYSEEAYDLLSPPEDTNKLRIFDDVNKKGSIKVDGLREIAVESASEIYEILGRGSAKRQCAATMLNACSSRSHSIFTITAQVKVSTVTEDQEIIKTGKLNLVDLAGSENIARSGAQNKHAREAGNINQSLLTLTRVIKALVERQPHIPYRESKLTRILQDSLGGSTRTSMIATISPADEDLGNTIGTLDYASRAGKIINRPESNRQMTQRKTSDLDIEAFKSKLKSELEIQIRNEVALEFRRETDKIKEQYNKVLSDKNEQIYKINLTVSEWKDKYEDLVREKEQIGTVHSDLAKANEELALETKELTKNLKIIQQVSNDRAELIDKLRVDFKRELDEKQARNEELESDNAKLLARLESCRCEARLSSDSNSNRENLENHLDELPEEEEVDDLDKPQVRKAAKVRKRAPVQEELNDYANMTFDGDDEIVQLSAKKARKKITAGGKKRELLHKELTMSGRKKRLRSVDEDVELSPVSPPARVTRSRATRRKLEY